MEAGADTGQTVLNDPDRTSGGTLVTGATDMNPSPLRDDPGSSAGGRAAPRVADGDAAPPGGPRHIATVDLLLFAAAREAAGTAKEQVQAGTVSEVVEWARARFSDHFAAILERSRIWLNGEPATGPEILFDGDEVAVLPPVSGG
jgi:molybdopterin synthase sulfur carrier subunit